MKIYFFFLGLYILLKDNINYFVKTKINKNGPFLIKIIY